MKQKLFSKKELIIILLISAVLIFAFSWYSLRPHLAKQECIKKAEKFQNSSGQSFEKLFKNCLLRKGYLN